MKFSQWLAIPNPDGRRKRKREIAAKIGVHPTMVTEYAEGRAIPRPEIMENIVRESDGAVLPNDFYNLPAELLTSEAVP